MLDIFNGLRIVVKRRNISIDNAVFRCHWFFTFTLLVSFSLIITARQYVGQPIECHSVSKIPHSLLNTYCWVQSTFIVPQACNQHVGGEVPYPCIDNTKGREVKMYAYYQWVGIVIFIQGLLFHLPYYLWKVWENGLIKAITGGLRVAVLSDSERAKKREIVVEYIQNHLGCHNPYAFKYFLCELICLINLIGQLWVTNRFFDGQFLRYGLDVMQYSSSTLSSQLGLSSLSSNFPPSSLRNVSATQPEQSSPRQTNGRAQPTYTSRPTVDPMTFIFPRITKCTYYDFGSSGDVQKHDALCLLPLNIINEKIYVVLWFWFLILALLTLLVIFYRVLTFVSEEVRCKGLISRCKLSSEQDIRTICQHCEVGDWFLFYMVAENLDPLVMREIIGSIADTIRRHFENKRRLMLDNACDEKYLNKQALMNHLRASDSFDETLSASSRRTSVAEESPLLKVRKRLYSKRLWSIDLGPIDIRRQLFGNQPPTNPDYKETTTEPKQSVNSSEPTRGAVQSIAGRVSAAQAPTVELSSMPPSRAMRRLGSTSSTNSASFVMDMNCITDFGATGAQGGSASRRSSVHEKPPQPRKRALQRRLSHHLSIGSLTDLETMGERQVDVRAHREVELV